ncbi:S-adenosylmethionine synthetase [Thermobaculum terrenum ATCC BAA-798]|uniref:S-adenosylmethionine synthase n=1 Tax=Thermobaculum terrenum (strain ATCC BAA-798 / CCMEE 7001 / YNP1) TaxID=525904 RepID=D1CBC9_THET1|nr:S-adenosylmethionine synthetase [Thermobaculum terrenum ATCC BAA-798]
MADNFMEAERLLFTSESVTQGHPDKICDQISDAVLDAFLAIDPNARVACEAAVTTGLVMVFGEITLREGYVDIPSIVRDTVKEIGYTSSEYGFDYETCGVVTSIKEQSSDIAIGVDSSLEVKTSHDVDPYDQLGAGDQGMMIGFACDETPELMPMPIYLAHALTKRLDYVRKSGIVPYFRPDGKSQVTVEYSKGRPVRVDTVVVSIQHDPDVTLEQIRKDVREHVVEAVIPSELIDKDLKLYVNPTGRFVSGGPKADAGLTGRKIIVDTYGGMARHGGGAFSGKDPTKVDRSASYMARYIAKNIVAAGLARRCELQVSYAIGVAHPISIMVETFGTCAPGITDAKIEQLIREHFDLRPKAILDNLRLQRPIYKPTATYGHFGRSDIDAPWEQTDKADALRRAAGIELVEQGVRN